METIVVVMIPSDSQQCLLDGGFILITHLTNWGNKPTFGASLNTNILIIRTVLIIYFCLRLMMK